MSWFTEGWACTDTPSMTPGGAVVRKGYLHAGLGDLWWAEQGSVLSVHQTGGILGVYLRGRAVDCREVAFHCWGLHRAWLQGTGSFLRRLTVRNGLPTHSNPLPRCTISLAEVIAGDGSPSLLCEHHSAPKKHTCPARNASLFCESRTPSTVTATSTA